MVHAVPIGFGPEGGTRVSTIIIMTWKEMLRKRVVLLTLIATLIFLIAFWFLSRSIGMEFSNTDLDAGSMEHMINQYKGGTIVLIIGFFLASFVLAFLAIFSSVSVIAGEAEQGVLQALIPRPITRAHFYLGRWIGFVSLGIGYALLLFLAILGVAEIHTSVPASPESLAKAFLLFASVVPLLVSLSMLGSCYMSAMGNGVLMTMLYGAGWLGGMLNKIAEMGVSVRSEATMRMIGGLLDMAMPADALQRRMLTEMFSLDKLQPFINLAELDLGPFGLMGAPSNTFLLYTLGYLVLFLFLGIRAFRKKDL
jgi:ABC-type transport system involved in multi-copper enzyme maturation permease subunit